jgi:cytochrome c553
MPPILGTKELGNFTVSSFPAAGTALVALFGAAVVLLALGHLVRGLRGARGGFGVAGIAAAFLFSSLVASGIARAQAPREEGIESAGYVWNEMEGEKVIALARAGDPARGAQVYEPCASCHLPNGAGRSDGAFPQLAGQHATVLVKQIADIRAGRRDNPIMYPYAALHAEPRELADVAAYLQSLPVPQDHGQGPGGEPLERGEALYRRDCQVCHGDRGLGDAGLFQPRLAGQHYEYLLRQLRDIAARRRRNANPAMVERVERYTDAELQAVADYAARLSAAPAPRSD